MNIDQPATLKRVNRALAKQGVPERLYRGKGYYYFADGGADNWPATSVYVYSARHLTVRQFLEEYESLKSDAARYHGAA